VVSFIPWPFTLEEYPMDRRLGGPQRKENNFCTYRGSEAGHPATLTELSGLLNTERIQKINRSRLFFL
jgi:hypothetical protein